MIDRKWLLLTRIVKKGIFIGLQVIEITPTEIDTDQYAWDDTPEHSELIGL